MSSVRTTVADALVRFLVAQYTERDGVERRLVAGCAGIFGHGNVAGLGEALRRHRGELRYYLARNEQAMVHTAAAYARMSDRLATLACTTSVGPGATNLVTGAAGATVNRLPVLLLPGDVFATGGPAPVLQELEHPSQADVSVNDCLRPVSVFWARVTRPEQLASVLVTAAAALTDPSRTGAVTIALPQDVQAEAFDFPDELFRRRVWHVRRPPPEPSQLRAAAELVRGAERPLLVSGGGTIYSGATDALRALAESTGTPVAETQAGKGSLPFGHPLSLGGIGATGTDAANAIAHDADVVIGVGTRWTDFTTSSHSLFAFPQVRFVSVNVAPEDALKLSGLPLVADARQALTALRDELGSYRVSGEHRSRIERAVSEWGRTADEVCRRRRPGAVPSQLEVIGALEEHCHPSDVVVAAAGSLPGDLHRFFRPRDPKQYHVEYGYSCMGYEIAGGLGVRLADPERDVYVLVGDGSYLMMAQELVTAVQERQKLIVLLIDNSGFRSIGSLSRSIGAGGWGTQYRMRTTSGELDGERLPVDLLANAASFGVDTARAADVEELCSCLERARKSDASTIILVETDPSVQAAGGAWWDVPIAEVSDDPAVSAAREDYDRHRRNVRPYL